jgi:hypothetical protein
MVSMDIANPSKKGSSYLGKVRDLEGQRMYYNFFDSGKNPSRCSQENERRQEMG